MFDTPFATVMLDRNGEFLGARIAQDGQWRFPPPAHVPDKFRLALLEFEDRHYYRHPGVNPVSLLKATWSNLKSGRIVRGGSTLTMQVIRMTEPGRPRSFRQKVKEIVLATRAAWRYSKTDILTQYCTHAPFGGNIVGIDAAAWKYFGRDASQLSWAESAMLAVLPNAPGMIHPGRNPQLLLEKRNRLLLRLHEAGKIDETTYQLALTESLPSSPLPLPRATPHLMDKVSAIHPGERIVTSIDCNLQKQINQILAHHTPHLEANQVYNAAAIVLDVESGGVLAYVGNLLDDFDPEHGRSVDIIPAERSTGSLLKPLLYAAMLSHGEILPNTLIPDIPTQMDGFVPENFNRDYDGAVPASRALSRSLNVPAVWMLKEFSTIRFYNILKELGMTTLNRPASHYGLSLILGGAEGSLWDICGIYASLSRILKHYPLYDGMYDPNDIFPPTYYLLPDNQAHKGRKNTLQRTSTLSAASIWYSYKAMLEVTRPDEQSLSHWFSSNQPIAWKTGTSYGNRDAWAIGTTPEYVVGVWVGNADGEGRPNLTGLGSAAPILFDIFRQLPSSSWFIAPLDDMTQIAVCQGSGYRAGPQCPSPDSLWIQVQGIKTAACPYHVTIHLDEKGQRANSECYPPHDLNHVQWFVLPPVQAYYYQKKNLSYKTLPPWRTGCNATDESILGLIYPRPNARIFVPVELSGHPGRVVFEAVHRDPGMELYWHLDERFKGVTRHIHQMALNPEAGKHRLTIIDGLGNSLSRNFEILSTGDK